MAKPQISVVVCTKNEEKYIGTCLARLKNQTLKPTEIIIVDAHSKDKTIQIAKKFADNLNSRVQGIENYSKLQKNTSQIFYKIIYDSGGGVREARNLGWQAAKGNIVAYCDADCRPSRDWTLKIAQHLEKYPAVTGPLISYDNGFKLKSCFLVWANWIPSLLSYLGNDQLWGANMAFRKEVLKKYPFKARFLEDYELGCRLRKKKLLKFSTKLPIRASTRRFVKSFNRTCIKQYLRVAMYEMQIKNNFEDKGYFD